MPPVRAPRLSSGSRPALGKRLRLPRQRGKNGKALVAIDVPELNHTPMVRTGNRRSPDDHLAVSAALKARILVTLKPSRPVRAGVAWLAAR
jgi:hypothetical protein